MSPFQYLRGEIDSIAPIFFMQLRPIFLPLLWTLARLFLTISFFNAEVRDGNG